MTHITISGLLACALGYGRVIEKLRRADRDLVACNRARATYPFTYPKRNRKTECIWVLHAPTRIPTCPRCAVLRDEALEGILPEGYR